jgi:hypothetical protein
VTLTVSPDKEKVSVSVVLAKQYLSCRPSGRLGVRGATATVNDMFVLSNSREFSGTASHGTETSQISGIVYSAAKVHIEASVTGRRSGTRKSDRCVGQVTLNSDLD